MPTEPLRAFSLPQFLGFFHNSVFSLKTLFVFFFVCAVIYWMIETVISIYHWWVYAHSPRVSSLAVITHLGVSGILLLFTLSGLL